MAEGFQERRISTTPATPTEIASARLKFRPEDSPEIKLAVLFKLTAKIEAMKTALQAASAPKAQQLEVEAPAILSRSREEMRGTEAFEAQYLIQTADLKATGQANDQMPSRIEVVNSLTPEILARALRIRNQFGGEPTGLLVADNDRHAKKRAIDANKVLGQTRDTYFYSPDNTDLWNEGKPWPEKKPWEYIITAGQEDIEDDANIRGKIYPRTKAWVQKYRAEDLEIFSGADPYLTLQRNALSQGKRINRSFFSVLNAENLTESSLVAFGLCYYAQVSLNFDASDDDDLYLRVRPAVRVPLKKLISL